MSEAMSEKLEILRRNFLTPVVLSIYTLAVILLFLREYRDAWFVTTVITINTVFAIVQELRARKALRELELMSAPHARVQRTDGAFKKVLYSEVLAGDTIQLLPGDEIPADGTIQESSGLEVNESMLTGESAAISKEVGQTVLAGSAVVAGSALASVTAVGADTKAGTMTAQLKQYKPELTPLQKVLARLVTTLTWVALGIMIIIYAVYWYDGHAANIIFKTITSAGITIIPEGLILASTLLLAFGSMKLARAKVLPQKISAIEGMALLDVLCTDKTGTLTSDTIRFDRLSLFSKNDQNSTYEPLLQAAMSHIGGGNATSDAVIEGLPHHSKKVEVLDTLAFSSARKLSGIRFMTMGTTYTFFVGAPEYVSVYAPLSEEQRTDIARKASEGKRILLVASFDDNATSLKQLKPKSARALGVIELTNELRDGVKKTVEFLQESGVSIRVISGDNPDTVRYVTKSAGIRKPSAVITGAELAEVSEDKWDETVLNTTIFARVLPEQKEKLITTFQKNGLYAGMVGDGVNDALALKKSDLGVAMYAGAAASRRVSDIILLNNSFTALPLGMKLGNRIMQAIEIIAILFFHKIIYGVVVLALTMLIGVLYPFEPRHNTFMNMFMISLPTIMWTLFPPIPQHRVNPTMFWRDTLRPIIPIALLSGITVTGSYLFMLDVLALERPTASTATVLIATLFGVHAVFLSSTILAVKLNKAAIVARLFYLLAGVVILSVSFGLSITRTFFDFVQLDAKQITQLVPAVAVVVIVFIMQRLLAIRTRNLLLSRSERTPF